LQDTRNLLSTLSLSTQMRVLMTIMAIMRPIMVITTMLAALLFNSRHVPSVREMTPT